jgi:hypothetical protein
LGTATSPSSMCHRRMTWAGDGRCRVRYNRSPGRRALRCPFRRSMTTTRWGCHVLRGISSPLHEWPQGEAEFD